MLSAPPAEHEVAYPVCTCMHASVIACSPNRIACRPAAPEPRSPGPRRARRPAAEGWRLAVRVALSEDHVLDRVRRQRLRLMISADHARREHRQGSRETHHQNPPRPSAAVRRSLHRAWPGALHNPTPTAGSAAGAVLCKPVSTADRSEVDVDFSPPRCGWTPRTSAVRRGARGEARGSHPGTDPHRAPSSGLRGPKRVRRIEVVLPSERLELESTGGSLHASWARCRRIVLKHETGRRAGVGGDAQQGARRGGAAQPGREAGLGGF